MTTMASGSKWRLAKRSASALRKPVTLPERRSMGWPLMSTPCGSGARLARGLRCQTHLWWRGLGGLVGDTAQTDLGETLGTGIGDGGMNPVAGLFGALQQRGTLEHLIGRCLIWRVGRHRWRQRIARGADGIPRGRVITYRVRIAPSGALPRSTPNPPWGPWRLGGRSILAPAPSAQPVAVLIHGTRFRITP